MLSVNTAFSFLVLLAHMRLSPLPLQGQRLSLRYPDGEWIVPGSNLDIRGKGGVAENESI
jgi:hypothetical protein